MVPSANTLCYAPDALNVLVTFTHAFLLQVCPSCRLCRLICAEPRTQHLQPQYSKSIKPEQRTRILEEVQCVATAYGSLDASVDEHHNMRHYGRFLDELLSQQGTALGGTTDSSTSTESSVERIVDKRRVRPTPDASPRGDARAIADVPEGPFVAPPLPFDGGTLTSMQRIADQGVFGAFDVSFSRPSIY